MAIAGKVAITPGGEWSVDVSYDKLVVVTFGNNVYLSIKPSTGIEPTNEEYWMLLIENVTQEQYDNIINGTTTVGNANKLGGKGASEYALKAKRLDTSILEKALEVEIGVHDFYFENYTGEDLPHNSYKYGCATVFKRGATAITVALWGYGYVYPLLNNYYNGGWGGWIQLAIGDLANYLPLSGGTVEDDSRTPLRVSNSVASKVAIAYFNNDTLLAEIGVNVNKPFFRKDGVETDILHTGNKPTGTYTGNGSARTIETGGIGDICSIYRQGINVCAIAMKQGTLVMSYTDYVKEVRFIATTVFDGGKLIIQDAESATNLDGGVYCYQVL